MYVTEIARRLWPRVELTIPVPPSARAGVGGRPRVPDEAVFIRLVLFLHAGCSWETFDELSKGSGVSGATCRRRLKEWRQAGVFEQVEQSIRSGLDRPEEAHLDAVFVRSRGGGDELGLTRRGKGSKLQVVCDEDSLPVAWELYSASPSESRTMLETLASLGELPSVIVADKAYDVDALREEIRSLGGLLLVPHKKGRVKPPLDQEEVGRHYKRRWLVERFFAWLAAWRRVATRWERRAASYRSWVCLAFSLVYTQRGL